MPYQQRSIRRIRRHVVTYGDVCLAHGQVCHELERLGFWNDRLADVRVYWVSASWTYYGWYLRDIYIPAVSGANLSDWFGGKHTRLTDVLRHEWAHALADLWPELIQTQRFDRTFGAPYESDDPIRDYHPDHHLTHYSASMPCEDFAEVFHYYLRHKGRLPLRLAGKPGIVKKWCFVEWIATRIAKSR